MRNNIKSSRDRCYVGIDVSTTGTAITTYRTITGVYEYYLIAPIPFLKTKKEKEHGIDYDKIEHPKVNYFYYDNSGDCVHTQVKHFMKKYSHVINLITKSTKQEYIFGIEDYAYSASGNNSIKLIYYCYEARKYLYDRGHSYYNINIQSNKKQFSGFGDADKSIMIETLFKRDGEFLLDITYDYLSDFKIVFKKPFKRVLKLEDVADSRGLCEYVQNEENLTPKVPKKRKKRKTKIKLPFNKVEEDLL